MKFFLSLVLALIAVLLIVNTVSEGGLPDGAAVATQVAGTVRIFTRESPEGRLIGNNDRIARNDRVEVEGNSRLELRLPEGSYLRLAENTHLTIRMLKFEKRRGTMNLRALFNNGRVWAKIKKRAASDSRAEVITRTAFVTANDSVFGMEAADNAGTSINVYEGVALAANTAGEASRAAGRAGAHGEGQAVSVQALQEVSTPAPEGVLQPRDFDPKSTIDDWVRWNLQRDAREELLSITVAPALSTVIKGRSLQFTGVAHYPDKIEKDITWFATWSSSDVSVANIDPSGMAEGTEFGAANISAAIEDVNGSTVLNVSRELYSIAVTPASRSVKNGAVQQFKAIGTFSDRTVRDITSSVVWRSSNPNVAFVDAAGRAVAGNKSGTAVISASLGKKRGRARLKVRRELLSITIMPASAMTTPGETQRFGAVGNYSDGTTQDLTEKAYWESSDLGIALTEEVLPGRIVGQHKGGSATIKASYKGKSGSATITVVTADSDPSP